jgi:hypothetical protein
VGYGFGNRISVGRRAITAQAQAEQVIWKVAIFNAGEPTSNGEYVWNGSELANGKPIYRNGVNFISYQNFSGTNYWGLFDDVSLGDWAYQSLNLTDWIIGDSSLGASPAPSSALSYSQSSFISSVTISYQDDSSADGTYSRASGGTTNLSHSANNNVIFYLDGEWFLYDATNETDAAYSLDLVKWQASGGFAGPVNATAISYSA